MHTSDLCKDCWEEMQKAQETSDFIEKLKASVPCCEESFRKNPELGVTSTPVAFPEPKKPWEKH